MPQTIVIAGGGFAGVECARRLERILPADWQIVLFNEQNHITFTPLLAEVVGSSISPLHVVWTIRQMLRRTVCHTAEISRLDFPANEVEYKLVQGRIGRQKYDQLILACGMVVKTDVVPGTAAHSYPLKTLGDAVRLRNHVIHQLERAEVETDPERRRHLLSFAVLGGGFSGVEVAGEIFDLLIGALPFYRTINRSDVHVTIVQGPDHILPELPAKLGGYAHRHMAARGIEIRFKSHAAAVTESGVCLGDGTTIPAATVISTIGIATNPLIAACGLPLDHGRIATLPDMRVAGRENVWAMGDCALVPKAYDGKPSPTLAQFAVRQARQLAKNIGLHAAGRPTRPFHYRMLGSFAAIGRHVAVAQVLGLTFAGFLAWFLWRGIYWAKMPTVARKVQIAFDWGWDLLFSRDICELSQRETVSVPRAHYQAGDEVFRHGDAADKFYIIEKGVANVYVDGWSGPIVSLGPGEFFGERELMRTGSRRFSVRAQEPLDVLAIGFGPIQDFLSHMQALRTSLDDRIARMESLQELRNVIREHPVLGQKNVAEAMTSPPPTIRASSNFAAAISHFHREMRTAFVVVDDENRLQGICTVTDLHNALCALRSLNTPLTDIMKRAVVTIKKSESLAAAMTMFLLKPVKRLVVIADDDPTRPVGLLTPFDVLLHYASHEVGVPTRGARPTTATDAR